MYIYYIYNSNKVFIGSNRDWDFIYFSSVKSVRKKKSR